MQRAGGRDFGLWATSYGGWIGSLWSCVEGGFRFIALVQPIIDSLDVIWRSPASRAIRRQLRRTGVTPDSPGMPTLMRLGSAALHRPLDDARRVLLLAGDYDTHRAAGKPARPERTLGGLALHPRPAGTSRLHTDARSVPAVENRRLPVKALSDFLARAILRSPDEGL